MIWQSLSTLVQHIHISHHIHSTRSHAPLFLHMYKALLEFQLRPTDWLLQDCLVPCFLPLPLFLLCPLCRLNGPYRRRARGSFLKRASNELTCWDVPDHQMGSVECYQLCLHQCQRNSGIFKSEKKLMSMSCLCQTFAYVQPTPSWLVLRIYYDLPLFGRRPFPFVRDVIIFLKAEPECFVSLLRNCV